MNLRSIKFVLSRILLLRRTLLAKTSYFGLKMRIRTEDGVGRHIYKYGAHEPEQTQFLIDTLNIEDGDVIFDVGANIGWYSLILDRLAGSRSVDVFCFEPEQINFDLLEENVSLNGANHVKPQHCGVADSTGEMTLRVYKGSNRGRHSLLNIHEGDPVEVPTVSLDDFWISNNLGERVPRFIKMDIEGFELMALRGAHDVLSRCPFVMLEYSPDVMKSASLDPGELLDLMLDHGFVANELSGGSLQPIDTDELRTSDTQVDLFWYKK